MQQRLGSLNVPLKATDLLSPRLKQSPEDFPLTSCHTYPVWRRGAGGSLFSLHIFLILPADF